MKPPPTPWGRAAVLAAAMLAVPIVALLLVHTYVSSPVGRPLPTASPSAVRTEEPAEDRTPEVRGHILDADGNPVGGAWVRLVSATAPYTVHRDTRSDAAGGFSFAHVRPESVRVIADHDPEGVVTSAELIAGEGQTKELTLVLSQRTVRGTVVDPQGHPVSGAVLSTEGAPWFVRTATTDEAGAFRLAAVPEEATSLVAVARGYRSARVALEPRQDKAELVLRVRLEAAPPVDGEVRDGDGNPVQARVVACEGQAAEAHVSSAPDGTFQLPPSAIGCEAVADHDEYASSDPVGVVEGRHLVLRLKPGGAIEGVVVDERGTGLASFEIGIESFSAARSRSQSRGRRGFEDPRGSFRWDKLAPGSYVLSASAPGRPPARSDPIEVSAGAPTRGVRIALPQGGAVAGHVFDELHAPIAGVELRFDVVSSTLESGAVGRTDDSGSYRIEGAPSGPFTLRAQKDGFRVRLVSGLRVAAGGTLTQDIALSRYDGGTSVELAGIGATLQEAREGITVGFVFPGDPAERAGLRAGDRLVRIDGEDADGLSVADAIQRLRGEVGTSVGVSVRRPSTGETLDVLIVRAAIRR